jgi:hypothetical protein
MLETDSIPVRTFPRARSISLAKLRSDASVDATFRYDDGALLPFIEYLRLAFRCGGFPGTWRRNCGPAVTAARRALSRGLLDL